VNNGIGRVGWRFLVLVAALVGSAYVLATGEEPARQPRGQASRPHREETLTAEQQTEVMAFAKENAPELYERVAALQKQDPQRAALLMDELYRLYNHAKDYPPEVRRPILEKQRLNVAIYRQLRQYRQADSDKQREDAKNQIQQLLGAQFDADQVIRDYDIKRLARQLDDLKAQLEQHKQNRAGIIGDRLNRLLKGPATASRGSGNFD
jgi:hypothetical protein